jgi:AmmeMemoRadiSam system protein B
MKLIRSAELPPGWYPQSAEEIEQRLAEYTPPGGEKVNIIPVRAALAPHAGWFYSGAIAWCAVCSLRGDKEPDTVAVIGGHLPPGAQPRFAVEESFMTPLGEMDFDSELRDAFYRECGGMADVSRDNTVEVLVPMVKFAFPRSRLLWARFPGDISAFAAGGALARAASRLGRHVVLLASSDLTHYGDNYGFSPKGKGEAALRWVAEVNDFRFIDAVFSGDPHEVLARAEKEYSACSPGAVLGAMGFCTANSPAGAPAALKVRFLKYGTSADVHPERGVPDSFVGYAALAWE